MPESLTTNAEVEGATTQVQHSQDVLKQNPPPAVQKQEQQKIEQLVKTVDKKADEKPEDLAVQHSATRFALQAGDNEKALQRAEQTVKLAEAKGDQQALDRVLITRSMAKAASKDYEGACADAQRVLKDYPKDPTAIELRLFNCDRPKIAPAIEKSDTMRWLAQRSPDIPHTPEQWAAKQKKKRTPSFEEVAAAMQARKTGDFAAELKHAQTATIADPNDPMAWAQKGLAETDLKQFDAAIIDLSRAIAMGMVWNILHKLRAQALLQARRYDAAAQDATIAIHQDPADASSYATRGLAREHTGASPDQVLADFEAAAKLDPAAYGALYEQKRAQLGPAAQTSASEPGTRDDARGQPAPRSLPWWVSVKALGAGVGLLVLALALGAYFLLRPERHASPSVVGGCFRLGPPIGAGGMGTVYEAWDTNLDRPVAVKRMNERLRDDAEEAARFIQEAKVVASLKHPNIVAIHDAFKDNGELYLVFELVRGETLSSLVERRGKVPAADALKILGQIADALDYAHARGVIHRDLKPNNVMLEDGRAKVMDFGIARRTDSRDVATMTSQLIGTPTYMAPEQEHGEVSRESDLYALGIVAFHLLTGKLPFGGGAAGHGAKLEGRAASVSPELDPVFARALHPDRKQRFHSAAELVQALRGAVPA